MSGHGRGEARRTQKLLDGASGWFAEMGKTGWGWGDSWERIGEKNPEVQLVHDLFDMSGRPQRRCQVAGRICGSKLVEEVIATETNLEVISLRIFKSMGTDEITREQGSEKGEAALAPTPRTPAIRGPQQSGGTTSPRRSGICISGTAVPPASPRYLAWDRHPPKPCCCGVWRGAVLRQKEKWGVGRSQEKKMLEGGRERPPGWTPCIQESEICQHRGDCHSL